MSNPDEKIFVETGAGEPVVVLGRDEGVNLAPLIDELSRRNRVLTINPSAAARIRARDVECLAHAQLELGIDRYSIVGLSEGVPIAIRLALLSAKSIHRLIMLSPPRIAQADAEIYQRLPEIDAPALVMVGTRDRSGAAESARCLKAGIRSCHLSLIYDAGRDVLSDRPQACITPICEFLERGEEFIVCHESQMIRP